LKFPKLNTQAQQREAVVQGRNLPPIPASVYKIKSKMYQSNNALDKWASRILFLRYLGWGVLFLVVLISVGVFSYNFWSAVRPDVFDFPKYGDLDSASEKYWADRMERDIVHINKMNVSEIRKAERLRVLVARQLGEASKLESIYERNRAILNIATILTKHDLDADIDKTLRTMDETYGSYSIRARIYISIALMQVRKKNFVGAMNAYSEYKRLSNHADLKLDSSENEESFIGAVTVLLLAQNIEELSDLFRLQIEFSRRIGNNQRMRAYRMIAVEQARSGSFLQNSLNTLRMVQDTVEMSRAIQLVVTYVSRPPKIEPIEPVYSVPRSDGPWDAIRSTLVVRNTIDNILQIIVKDVPEFEPQRNVLIRVAGSVLMCDPDVYKVFRSAVQEAQGLDETVRIPVLKLLDNPISDKIRAELKMPPRVRKRSRNSTGGVNEIDPAKHDWIDDKDAIDIQITSIDADTLESMDIRQYTRILTLAATSYLQVNRPAEAITTLRKAFNIAKKQSDPTEQIRALIAIAELQFDTGEIDDALNSLQLLNRKLKSLAQVEDQNNYDMILLFNEITDEQILSIVQLQILGHLFDDAGKTVQFIRSISLRDFGLGLIMRELLRAKQLDTAARMTELFSDPTTRNEYKHRLVIAQTESKIPIQSAISVEFPESSLSAVGINNSAAIQGDKDISRNVSQLIRFGCFEAAVVAVKRISDEKLRSKLLSQIGREYVLVFNSYSRTKNRNRVVSERAFNKALIISEIISDVDQRVIFTLAIINAILANKRYEEDAEILQQLFDSVLSEVENIASGAANVGKDDVDEDGDVGVVSEGVVGGVVAGDSLRQLRGEIFSQLLLSRLNFELLRAGVDRVDRAGNDGGDKVQNVVDENLLKLSGKVISELKLEGLTLSKGRGLVNVSLFFLRAGRLQDAAEAVKLAELVAEGLSNRSHAIAILVDLMPIYKSLNDAISLKRVRDRAMGLAVSFIPAGIDLRHVNVTWRMRDIELDRVIRKLVELSEVEDLMSLAANVHEPIIFDRVVRVVVYIYLDQNNFNAAESAAKKLRLQEYRFSALRDTNLMKNLTKTETDKKN
jgi:tetratricopeptide (TPR) repeat protein